MAKSILFLILTLCLIMGLVGTTTTTAQSLGSKVSTILQTFLGNNNKANIIISITGGIDAALDQVVNLTFTDRGAQAQAVYNALNNLTITTQAPVLSLLNSLIYILLNISIQTFWISNQIYVQGANYLLISALSLLNSVEFIEQESIVLLVDDTSSTPQPIDTNWGINITQAELAWGLGYNGGGGVVGIIDTGARYTHEAIVGNYRGGSHSWYDPYSQTQTPADGNGHGTHCTGTIAGIYGIGVAPGAKWISCKGLQDTGFGLQSALLACGQFMLCPTTYNKQNPQCGLAPHVVSNTWTSGSGVTWFDSVMRSWQAANIIPVSAIGTDGPSCSTATSPGDSSLSIGVGATNISDGITSFSSRGPGPSLRIKPDISAPGQSILSAGNLYDSEYTIKSGTSMACSHVAGIIGILKGQSPNLKFSAVNNILQTTSNQNLSFGSQICGGKSQNQFPNNVFGYGRINALNAISSFL